LTKKNETTEYVITKSLLVEQMTHFSYFKSLSERLKHLVLTFCCHCPSVKTHLKLLADHWASQELRYDREAEIAGNASRNI